MTGELENSGLRRTQLGVSQSALCHPAGDVEQNILEEILQPDASVLEELRAELRYDALGWQGRHGGLGEGEGHEEVVAEGVELGVALLDADGASLVFTKSAVSRGDGGRGGGRRRRTLRVSIWTFQTTKAPMPARLPLTTAWSSIVTLLAQQAALASE
jgi:hypothetical protein